MKKIIIIFSSTLLSVFLIFFSTSSNHFLKFESMFKKPNENQEESKPEISNSGSSSNSSTTNNSGTLNKNQILISGLAKLNKNFIKNSQTNPFQFSSKIDKWWEEDYKAKMSKKTKLSLPEEFNRCFTDKKNAFNGTKRNYTNLNKDFNNSYKNTNPVPIIKPQNKVFQYLYYFFIFEYLSITNDNVFFFMVKSIFRKEHNLTIFKTFLPDFNFQFLEYKNGKIDLIKTYDKIIENFIQNYDSNIDYNASKRIVIDICVSND